MSGRGERYFLYTLLPPPYGGICYIGILPCKREFIEQVLHVRGSSQERVFIPNALACMVGPVIPILWITKEIMSRGPQVACMECRETT
jgi:hypothetical protein